MTTTNMADASAGAPNPGIPASSFYGRRLEESTDALFHELDNGNLSDLEGEIDNSSDSGDDLEEPEQEHADSEEESADDVCEVPAAAWTKKKFVKPDTSFECDELPFLNTNEEMPSPWDYFSHYVPKSIFIDMAERTNQYSLLQEGRCVGTNEQEIRQLISLHLIMGVMRYPRLRLYWKPEMKTRLVASTELSRNRFEKLRNNLHIVDVSLPDPKDRFWKVRPLLDKFEARCRSLKVEERLCIDEQIVPFKGKLDIKQYVKGKPHPWGVKIFMLCGESGIVYSSLPYQGSTTRLDESLKQQYGVTGAIVSQLAHRIPCDKGHKLFFDNYFTSLPLLRMLLDKKIFAAGTIRVNRCQKCPLEPEKNLKQKGRGSSASVVSKDGKVAVTRWYDNKAVTLASNFVAIDDEDTAKRWSKKDGCYIEVKRPAVVRMYNSSMGGVDKTDFLVALYRTKIRSRKWTLRMIFHVINASVVNAWLEYRRDAVARGLTSASQLDLLDFTLSIAEALARVQSLPKARKTRKAIALTFATF
ncbi:hypothetical protein HPB51_020138 [Rhipicephalus microplus]|uniref:PiggyBac transposable element-derived protein domain-containing protein n=1 Tax=Rhipicephalus microplus TaxID=6941 RepID=A0A9J6EI25_RHIMP|nr:hypothetical protein HPB51_020138 [Rhipicephalus microplus]